MICTECLKPIEDVARAVNEFVGEHTYTKEHCVEGSPHQHVSCVAVNTADLPAEMLEPMRLKK